VRVDRVAGGMVTRVAGVRIYIYIYIYYTGERGGRTEQIIRVFNIAGGDRHHARTRGGVSGVLAPPTPSTLRNTLNSVWGFSGLNIFGNQMYTVVFYLII
jgi:hypothetical protein